MIISCVLIVCTFFTAAGSAFEDNPGLLASVPYQVSIQLRGKHRCSGAIVTNQYVRRMKIVNFYINSY